eukprot:7162253-Ditylum_brightwellii.AAC.1
MKEKHGIENTLEASTQIFQIDCSMLHFDKRFHYKSVKGKVNYFKKCTRPNIAYAAYLCTRCCKDPQPSYSDAVVHLDKYLAATDNKRLILDTKAEKFF